CASAMRRGARVPEQGEWSEERWQQPVWCSRSSRTSVGGSSSLFQRTSDDDGAILRDEIFLGDFLNLLRSDGEEAIEDGVDAFGVAIEQGEAREILHQSKAGHVGTHAAFEHRVIVRAKFCFDGIEFVRGNSLALDISDHGIVGGDGGVARVFGAMK